MTLTETATITKRFLRVFLIVGAALLILWIAFLYIYNNIVIPYQRSQEKAEQRFGPLPSPSYPPTLSSSASLTYNLDTRSGELPTNIPKLTNVYFLPPVETTLGSPDRARQLATALSFAQGPEILSPTQYRFKDDDGGTLIIDLSSGNFSFRRLSVEKSDFPQDEILPDEQRLGTIFKNYLDKRGLIREGLEEGEISVTYETGDNRTSNTALISLWPAAIDDYPIVTGNIDMGLINATATKYQDEPLRFSNMQYIYWAIDQTTFSTYSLIPVTQAFNALQQGSGIVVRNNSQGSSASISNVYLAYYMPEKYSSFLTPVYVFEGNQFTGYVPALTADSYAQ